MENYMKNMLILDYFFCMVLHSFNTVLTLTNQKYLILNMKKQTYKLFLKNVGLLLQKEWEDADMTDAMLSLPGCRQGAGPQEGIGFLALGRRYLDLGSHTPSVLCHLWNVICSSLIQFPTCKWKRQQTLPTPPG